MKVGRPLKFTTLKKLEKKINYYFKHTPKDEWTITGLALALDTSRQTLLEYEGEVDGREAKSKDFVDTIKKAKLMIENGYEIDLKKSGRSGTIFALKNFDWKDKTETELGFKELPKPIINVISENNSDKQNNVAEKEN